LLKRFLKGEKFVDEISPTIRIERLPRSEMSVPGVDKRAETAQAEKDRAPATLASLASTPSGLSLSPSGAVPIQHTVAVALLSMIVGAVLAVLWTNRRRDWKRGRQYERIPNAEAPCE
jgi:hypothetical protein